jgi:ferredoxin-type protein NapH
MAASTPRRQRVRRGLLLISFLLFPISLNYFSPYLIVTGAAQGVASGSMLVFAGLFVSSLLVGRLWCGWGCPAGALQDYCAGVNNRPVAGKWANRIKWFIWVPWLGAITALAWAAGGLARAEPLFMTESGVSVDSAQRLIVYYGVVVLLAGVALLAGRRASCHTFCWMAPFMIVGRTLRNWGRWPALHLRAEAGQCSHCRRCSQACPMSLDVHGLVERGNMEHPECILCGTCVDVCPRHLIRFRFSATAAQGAAAPKE